MRNNIINPKRISKLKTISKREDNGRLPDRIAFPLAFLFAYFLAWDKRNLQPFFCFPNNYDSNTAREINIQFEKQCKILKIRPRKMSTIEGSKSSMTSWIITFKEQKILMNNWWLSGFKILKMPKVKF